MQLFIKRSTPRAVILFPPTSSKALLLRQNNPQSTHLVTVEFKPISDLDLNEFVPWPREVAGVLGLVEGGGSAGGTGGSPDRECFLVVAERYTKLGNVRPGGDFSDPEPINRLQTISFHSLSSSTWDTDSAVAEYNSPDQPYNPSDAEAFRTSQYRDYANPANPPATPLFEHPLSGLKKILGAGSFFFADPGTWDVSSRLEERVRRAAGESISTEEAGDKGRGASDERFVWNSFLLSGLHDFRDGLEAGEDGEADEFDQCGFLLPIIQGFASLTNIQIPASVGGIGQQITLAIVSRLSMRRAGTRFNTRGVDDDGQVANFVETETIFSVGSVSCSWVQVRGSVPLFWEQQGLQTFGQKIQITRPQQASQPAFDKHFDELVDIYHEVHNINLLGQKDNEVILTTNYNDHLRRYSSTRPPPPLVSITNFDFHNAVKIGGVESVREGIKRTEGVRRALESYGWTSVDGVHIVEEQSGVFRTNCLDCLDRTNVINEILSGTVLEKFVRTLAPPWVNIPALWSSHSNLWADNGDYLSRIYAGTGALNTSFTRTGKRTLGGLLSDASKSVSRSFINTFSDGPKQIAIDMLLGLLAQQRPVEIYDPLTQKLRAALLARSVEFSTSRPITIFSGTWNLNGKSPGESLVPWLFPNPSGDEPDIYAIAFQEIVPLTAQQIVQTDPEKKRIWEKVIMQTFANRPGKKSDYILLRSEQLVGTALLILMKSSLASSVRNVEAASKKTGLRGMSGNKGGIAIRLNFFDTTLCFVTAHFAAGHSNVSERNADYRTITSGLRFLRNKTIDSHDMIIWAADFNYRIDGTNENVRACAERGTLAPLLGADQLIRAMQRTEVFPDYEEGEISFRPTYKYDNGSDNYDTSDKARIPAYTDRILWKGNNLDQILYERADLRTSDHRPVLALFKARVVIIDTVKKEALSQEIKRELLSEQPSRTGSVGSLSTKISDLSVDGRADDLPPPSSEKSQWWADSEDDFVKIANLEATGQSGNPWTVKGEGVSPA